MNRANNVAQGLARSPILWGGLASATFYTLVYSGIPGSGFLQRFCAGHPVEYVETAMFFVALAALAIKAVNVAVQSKGVPACQNELSRPVLGPAPGSAQPVADCEQLLGSLRRLPARRRSEYVIERLEKGLEYIARRGSPEGLDEELRYLADIDAERAHASYGLVRVVIWAIPILGFLGTVIGITLAIARLSPEALETSLPTVVAALGVAFDTTALALALSIVLFFAQFFVDRAESNLLAKVGDCVERELLGRFELIPAGPDGQVVAIRKMGESLLAAMEQLVQRQAEVWQASMEASQQRGAQMLEAAGRQLEKSLAAAVAGSLQTHAQALLEAERRVDEKNRRNWEQLHQGLAQYSDALAAVQHALVEKAEVLGRAVSATGQVAKLEETLNRNLSALAGARHFEQTVMSLAAAINLLSARLGDAPAGPLPIQLASPRRPGQAA